jgi:hypothetical protein
VTGNDIVRVLVVSETSREFLACRKFFQQYGCQCDLAKSYQEVMQLLDSNLILYSVQSESLAEASPG